MLLHIVEKKTKYRHNKKRSKYVDRK